MGLAVGSAAAGMRPVVEIMFNDFITIAMDQIVNQAAKMRYMFGGKLRLPITIRTMCGGGVNAGPQHSQSLEAWFVHVPGLKVVMPASPYDAKGLLKSAIRDDNPVVFFENKALYGMKGDVPEEEYLVPLGKAEVKRAGDDVTVVAISQMVPKALAAAEKLAGEGISVEVLDPRTLSPLDKDAIVASVRKTGRLVIAHEAVAPCGIGAEIAALAAEHAFDALRAPIKRVTAPFTPVPFAKPLEAFYLPNAERIAEAVKEIA
jgi:pyruvate dehydrogenase E1 component beta subunit